jgi:CheY-like chemotaxis protein
VAKRVLIVEDHTDTRLMLADLLSHWGYEVVTAVDGTQVLRYLHEAPPDLVTLDYNMPVMNGVQLLDKMRSTAGWTQVPVLVLSGSLDAPAWVAGQKHASYLQKPFTVEALSHALEDLAPRQPRILPKRL